jgi:hypothetical protein
MGPAFFAIFLIYMGFPYRAYYVTEGSKNR